MNPYRVIQAVLIAMGAAVLISCLTNRNFWLTFIGSTFCGWIWLIAKGKE